MGSGTRLTGLRSLARFVACGALLFAAPALGLTPEEKCQLAKIKETAKYVKCLLKAEDKAIKEGGGLPNTTKCDSKFSEKWAKAESKGGCTTEADEISMGSRLQSNALETTNLLMPTTSKFECDVFGQSDCPQGEACYVNTITEDPPTATCATIFGASTQGDDCEFLNDCAPGHSCLLIKSPNDGQLTCAFHCNKPSGGPSCADGGVPGFSCVRPSIFYGDVDRTPANFGICIDPNVFPDTPGF